MRSRASAPLVGHEGRGDEEAIQSAGLGCESCHYQFKELKENLDDRIAFAKELGLKQMILSSFGLQPDATLADWARAADELNKIGEQSKKAGLQIGFHNHHGEFKEIDGVLIYDKLMSELDPKLVKMQFQVSVINIGYEAATLLDEVSGPVHFDPPAGLVGNGEEAGAGRHQGVVDWKKLFAPAKKGGVKNYFVEMNLEAMKASYPYLHDLKV